MAKPEKCCSEYYKEVLTMSEDDQRIVLEEALDTLREELEKIETAISLIEKKLGE